MNTTANILGQPVTMQEDAIRRAVLDNGGMIEKKGLTLIDSALLANIIKSGQTGIVMDTPTVQMEVKQGIVRPSITPEGSGGNAGVSVDNGGTIGVQETTLSITFKANSTGADIPVLMFDTQQTYISNIGGSYGTYTPGFFTPALSQGASITDVAVLNYAQALPSFGRWKPFLVKSLSLINLVSTDEPLSFSTFKIWQFQTDAQFVGGSVTTKPIFQQSNVQNDSFRVGRYDAPKFSLLVNGLNGILFNVKDGDKGFRLEMTIGGAQTGANIASV